MNITPDKVANVWPCTERVNKAVDAERERILALPFIHEAFGGKHNEDCITCHNIALIKGENK